MSRCLLDNTPLLEVVPNSVGDRIPPLARELLGPVFQCATCGRVYRRGSHARRMERILEEVFPQH
ncbi:MAG: Mut7-C RNAse domain-containing protein [Gemmatimonadaceae bacterium]